jgi:hypothetical protein
MMRPRLRKDFISVKVAERYQIKMETKPSRVIKLMVDSDNGKRVATKTTRRKLNVAE